MSSATPNRGYIVYDADENSASFLAFRTDIAGTSAGSSLMKIDADMQEVFTQLEQQSGAGNKINIVPLTLSSNVYTATVPGLTTLSAGTLLIVSIDSAGSGIPIQIKINNFEATYFKRHDYSGSLVDVISTDIVLNREYLAYYNGSYFILVGCAVNEGNAGEMSVAFTQASNRTNVATGDKLKTLIGKVAKWFSDLGTLAFKSSVTTNDIAASAVTNAKQASMAGKTLKGNKNTTSSAPQDLTASEVRGILNVADNADSTTQVVYDATTADSVMSTYTILFTDPDGGGEIIKIPFDITSSYMAAALESDFAPATHNHDSRYYTETEVDTKLGQKAALSHTHVSSDISGLASVATSGSYTDLTDKPTIPTVPANLSEFNNDAGYLTASDVAGKQDAAVAVSGSGSISASLQNNREYTYTGVSSLSLSASSSVSCHGMITFGSSVSSAKITATKVVGDDITKANANEVWEFSCFKGYVVAKKWSD